MQYILIIPENPLLGSIKQGPLFRKRAIVKQVWKNDLKNMLIYFVPAVLRFPNFDNRHIAYYRHITLPVEKSCVEELRIAPLDISEDTKGRQSLQVGLQAVHLSVQVILLFVSPGVSLDNQHYHLVQMLSWSYSTLVPPAKPATVATAEEGEKSNSSFFGLLAPTSTRQGL